MKSRMTFPMLITLLISTASFVGCTKSNDGPAASQVNSIPTQSLTEAQSLAAQAQVYCMNPAGCSPSIAMLVGTTATSAYQCTAFLIAGDIVATNSHCIPGDLKTPNAATNNRLSIVFPNVGSYSAKIVDTKQVISASQIDSTFKNADFAFIRLASAVDRPALHITHDGLQDKAILKIEKMDPFQGNGIPEAYLREDNCRVVYGSALTEAASSLQSPVMAIGDCKVVHGNSGSPMINSNGEVPAIVFAAMDNEAMDRLLSNSASLGLAKLDATDTPLGLATSYACFAVPNESPSSLNSSCGQPESAAKSAGFSDQDKAAIKDRFEKSANQADPTLKWTISAVKAHKLNMFGSLEPDASSTVLVMTPECIRSEKALLDEVPHSFFGGYAEDEQQQVDQPMWTMQVGVNRYLQVEYRLIEAPSELEETGLLNFNPRQISKNHRAIFRSSNSRAESGSKPLYSAELGLCTPAQLVETID